MELANEHSSVLSADACCRSLHLRCSHEPRVCGHVLIAPQLRSNCAVRGARVDDLEPGTWNRTTLHFAGTLITVQNRSPTQRCNVPKRDEHQHERKVRQPKVLRPATENEHEGHDARHADRVPPRVPQERAVLSELHAAGLGV